MLGLRWAQLHPHPLAFSANPTLPGGKRRRDRTERTRSRDERSRPQINRRTQREFRTARYRLALPPVGPGPQLHLAATLSALEPALPDWPHNASVVGPLVWDPVAERLPIPAGQSPLVLVGPANAATQRSPLLTAALAGLDGMRLVSPVREPYQEQLPRWASVGPGQLEPLLARAAILVSDGGHDVIALALTAGVPTVVVPGAGESELAHRVERLGAAVVLRRVTPRSLKRAVERVLPDGSYTAAAQQVARTAGSADPVVLCHQTWSGGPWPEIHGWAQCSNAASTNALCSLSCTLVEPAAGLAEARRDTRLRRAAPGRYSGSVSAMNDQAPMLAGSSCTQT